MLLGGACYYLVDNKLIKVLMDVSFLILFFYFSVSFGLLIKASFLDAVMMGTKYFYLYVQPPALVCI